MAEVEALASVCVLSKATVRRPRTPKNVRKNDDFLHHPNAKVGVEHRSVAWEHVMHPGDKTQPTFLWAMMNYIRTELTFLGTSGAMPGDMRRLQVYREAFDNFIREFKTYEGILSEIKNEYEMALAVQQEQIDVIEPLRCKVAISKFEASQEILRIKNELAVEIQRLGDVNRHLQSDNYSLENEMKLLNAQISSLSEELRRNEGAIHGEEMARKRLSDYQEQMEQTEKNFQESLAQKEEELSELRRKDREYGDEIEKRDKVIDKLKEELGLCVPKVDLEALAVKLAHEDEENSKLTVQIEKLTSELEAMKELCKKREKQLHAAETDKLPNWEYIAFNCPGPVHEWGVLCRGMDFNDTIVVLVRQLLLVSISFMPSPTLKYAHETQMKSGKGGKGDQHAKDEKEERTTSSDTKFFVGLGIGTEVPKFLRYKGKIPNRKLAKKDCIQLVNDTWKAKTLHEMSQKKQIKISLAEFLFMFLKKRFGSQEVIAEWGYNLLFATQRHGFQSVQCQLFHDTITGALDESVYHHQQAMIELLKGAFQKFDNIKHEGKPRGIVSKPEAIKVLEEFWPWKSKEQVNQLISALEADQPGEMITYHWLFHADTDSLFLEVVREQYMEERDLYIKELQEKVRTITKDARVSATDILRCLSTHDPHKLRKDMDGYLARGFSMALEAIKPRSMIMLDSFLKSLKKGVVEKTHKKIEGVQ
ncbi:Translin-associated factor X-interacting protein 1 [Phlyctochytrium planicorne]|nr:Translin-associated factor X-interacting protein 1 [Phlyctochytrium planicorne]